MKLTLVFLLVVTILQYAHAQTEIQVPNTEIPSTSLPTPELPSSAQSIPVPTTYESIKYNAMYYSSSTMNIISEIISKPLGLFSSYFSSTSSTSTTPPVDTPTMS